MLVGTVPGRLGVVGCPRVFGSGKDGFCLVVGEGEDWSVVDWDNLTLVSSKMTVRKEGGVAVGRGWDVFYRSTSISISI